MGSLGIAPHSVPLHPSLGPLHSLCPPPTLCPPPYSPCPPQADELSLLELLRSRPEGRELLRLRDPTVNWGGGAPKWGGARG